MVHHFTALAGQCPYSGEISFPHTLCVNTAHARGKGRKVGHGQTGHTVVKICWQVFGVSCVCLGVFVYFALGEVHPVCTRENLLKEETAVRGEQNERSY